MSKRTIGQQLNLFQQGEDLPLFQEAEPAKPAVTPAKPAPAEATVNGFRDTGITHPYGRNGTYLEVSHQAAAEKHRNWHEIGWASGTVRVKHPDWVALYEHLLTTCPYMESCYPDPRRWGPAYMTIVRTPDGKLTFAGSVCRRDGEIELNG